MKQELFGEPLGESLTPKQEKKFWDMLNDPKRLCYSYLSQSQFSKNYNIDEIENKTTAKCLEKQEKNNQEDPMSDTSKPLSVYYLKYSPFVEYLEKPENKK